MFCIAEKAGDNLKISHTPQLLAKSLTGIRGLDEITEGGLPEGCTSLICGNAGCTKTILGMEFLLHGALKYNEPGIFVSFEETDADLTSNFATMGYDQAGDYNLDGLFIRLGQAIDAIGAKRVVLDSIEVLFGGLTNTSILRAKLRRLFRWLKEKGVTAIVTGERGERTLARHDLGEYMADCVVLLDLRVEEQISTRRLRVVKYRGSSILVSGTAGSGKSSVAVKFVDAACSRGESCLYFAFEESPQQIIRNMLSIGINLSHWIEQGLLRFHASRPSVHGREMHLMTMHKLILEFNPSNVVVDPISALTVVGSDKEAKSMLTRLIDFLKTKKATTMLTGMTHVGDKLEASNDSIPSLIDTWLSLRDIEDQGERNRGMYILKSRGIAHSNQIREFILSDIADPL